jgi:hypothetical protein
MQSTAAVHIAPHNASPLNPQEKLATYIDGAISALAAEKIATHHFSAIPPLTEVSAKPIPTSPPATISASSSAAVSSKIKSGLDVYNKFKPQFDELETSIQSLPERYTSLMMNILNILDQKQKWAFFNQEIRGIEGGKIKTGVDRVKSSFLLVLMGPQNNVFYNINYDIIETLKSKKNFSVLAQSTYPRMHNHIVYRKLRKKLKVEMNYLENLIERTKKSIVTQTENTQQIKVLLDQLSEHIKTDYTLSVACYTKLVSLSSQIRSTLKAATSNN